MYPSLEYTFKISFPFSLATSVGNNNLKQTAEGTHQVFSRRLTSGASPHQKHSWKKNTSWKTGLDNSSNLKTTAIDAVSQPCEPGLLLL